MIGFIVFDVMHNVSPTQELFTVVHPRNGAPDVLEILKMLHASKLKRYFITHHDSGSSTIPQK